MVAAILCTWYAANSFQNVMSLKSKLRAALWHFLITAALGALIAALIFLIWFPSPFGTMMDGGKLFALVLGCDLVMGPLMSLVIYNQNKSRRELIVDYSIIGALQLAALLYGVSVVAGYRPAYIAFTVDRFDVVSVGEFDPADLKEATFKEYQHLPWFGPELVVAIKPEDIKERNDAIFLALGGKDISLRPKYYRPYSTRRNDIVKAIRPLSELFNKHPDVQVSVTKAIESHHLDLNSAGWLAVKHRRGFWIAIMDTKTTLPIEYLPIDPY